MNDSRESLLAERQTAYNVFLDNINYALSKYQNWVAVIDRQLAELEEAEENA